MERIPIAVEATRSPIRGLPGRPAPLLP
jgi:hypothetical protein